MFSQSINSNFRKSKPFYVCFYLLTGRSTIRGPFNSLKVNWCLNCLDQTSPFWQQLFWNFCLHLCCLNRPRFQLFQHTSPLPNHHHHSLLRLLLRSQNKALRCNFLQFCLQKKSVCTLEGLLFVRWPSNSGVCTTPWWNNTRLSLSSQNDIIFASIQCSADSGLLIRLFYLSQIKHIYGQSLKLDWPSHTHACSLIFISIGIYPFSLETATEMATVAVARVGNENAL